MRTLRWLGVVAALVYGVGFVLVSSAPGGGDVDASDFQDFYVTDDNTAVVIIGLILLVLGAIGLLWFFHSLRRVIATADAAFGWAASAVGLALVAGGGALLAGPSGVQAFSDAEFVGEPVAHALAQSGFAMMLVAGSLFLGVGVAVLSLAGRKAGVLLPWVAIVGLVAAALQLLAFIWIPHFAIPIWVLIASAVAPTARTTEVDEVRVS